MVPIRQLLVTVCSHIRRIQEDEVEFATSTDLFKGLYCYTTLIYFDKIARICTHYISNPVSPDGASQNNPWLLLYKLLYKHVVCRQKAKKWKTIPGTYVFPTETRGDYFWIFLWPAVGGNTFSPLLTALILGPVRYNSCR